jgi:hypothetical protein
MTKAWQTPPKAIRVANGGRMRLGQIIGGSDTMQQKQILQRNMRRDQIGRDGRVPKVAETTATIPVSPGMKRQTKGEIGFHGGVAVDDLPNVGLKSYEKPIPIHSGMTAAQRDEVHPYANSAKEILTDAQHLGKRKRPAPAEKA